MIPGTLNSETHVTQIEIQNEFKTTEIKKSVNNNISLVKYSELLKTENPKECDCNAETIKDTNEDTAVLNAQECGKWFTVNNLNKMEIGDTNIRKEDYSPDSNKPGVYQTKYWVQYTMQTTADNPMEYSPDRNSFVAKVLSITFVMLIITSSFVALVVLSPDLRELFLDTTLGRVLTWCGATGILLLNYKVMCSPCMRVFPCNFVTLIIAVICMSLLAAYLTASHNTTMIVYALIATAVTVLVCFLLALTRFDFTKFVLYIFVVGLTLFVLTTVIFIGTLVTGIRFKPLELALLFVGTIINIVVVSATASSELVLFVEGFQKVQGNWKLSPETRIWTQRRTWVLVMELQLILGGKTVSLSEDDYALGAFMLYTSIVDIFLKLLQVIGVTLDEDGDFFADLL